MESAAFGVQMHKWSGRCTMIVLHSLASQSLSKQEGRRNQHCILRLATDPEGLEGPQSRRTRTEGGKVG